MTQKYMKIYPTTDDIGKTPIVVEDVEGLNGVNIEFSRTSDEATINGILNKTAQIATNGQSLTMTGNVVGVNVKSDNETRLSAVEGKAIFNQINVKDYGAVGDGVTDDTEAIQDAIDLTTKGIIDFGNGTYKISSTIVLGSYKSVKGDNATIIPNTTDAAIAVTGMFSKIEGVTIQGSGLSTGNGIELRGTTGVQNINIEKVTIQNMDGHGIEMLGGCWIIEINNCYITNNAQNGINIDNTLAIEGGTATTQKNNINITKTTSGANGGHGILAFGLNINIEGCVLEDNDKAGICIDYSETYANGTGVVYALNTNIYNNYFEENGYGCVYVKSKFTDGSNTAIVDGINIEGNYFYQLLGHYVPGYDAILYFNAVGSYVYNTRIKNVTITDNNFTASSTSPYFFDGNSLLGHTSKVEISENSTKYKNLGEITVTNSLKIFAVNGYSDASGATYTDINSTSSESIADNTTVRFRLPNLAYKIIQSIGLYVYTDVTNYTLTFNFFAKDAKTNGGYAKILYPDAQLTSLNGNGYRSLSIPQSYALVSGMLNSSYNDYYISVKVTYSGGTYMRFGNPVIEYY